MKKKEKGHIVYECIPLPDKTWMVGNSIVEKDKKKVQTLVESGEAKFLDLARYAFPEGFLETSEEKGEEENG